MKKDRIDSILAKMLDLPRCPGCGSTDLKVWSDTNSYSITDFRTDRWTVCRSCSNLFINNGTTRNKENR